MALNYRREAVSHQKDTANAQMSACGGSQADGIRHMLEEIRGNQQVITAGGFRHLTNNWRIACQGDRSYMRVRLN